MNAKSLPSLRRSHLLLLLLIVGFAAFLRCFSLSAIGFWTDELCSLSAADGRGLQLVRVPVNQIVPPLTDCTRLNAARPLLHIPASMASDDTHPPLYFMTLRLWETAFGDTERPVRSLNVVFSLLAIVLLYFVAIESVGSFAALSACLLMAVATPQIQYAQEARNYMPALVFSLLAALSIERLRRAPKAQWSVLLATSLLAMLLTHYLALGVAAGLAVYAILTLGKRARWLAVAAMISAALLFAALWVPSMLRQRPTFASGLGWLNDSASGHLQRRVFDLLRLPVRMFVEITAPSAQKFIALTGFMMLLAIAPLLVCRRELRLWICWWIASVAVVALADFTRSTTQLNWIRYTLFATPAAYVLLAAAFNRGRLKLLLPAIAVLASVLCLQNGYVPAWKTDLRTYVEIVAKHRVSADGLLIVGKDSVKDAVIFAAFQHYLPAMPTTALLTRPPDPSTLAALRQCRSVQVLYLWPDQEAFDLPGFEIRNRVSFPYFAELVQGSFVDRPSPEVRRSASH